jgi:ABC-type multidrug transport system ATPase subunit
MIEDLTKVYRGGFRALNGINLEIGTGTFGLLGPNGAGKTTLMRILVTLIQPTNGEVAIDGHRLSDAKGKQAIKKLLGYLPQELGLYPDLTAEEFVDYAAILKGLRDANARHKRVAEMLEVVGLSKDKGRKLKTYSGGMKRRVGIAQAIVNDPQLIIVDEPTAGLDPEERIRFRNLLAQLGRNRTVLLSTHIVEDIAQSCQRVAVQVKGQVVFTGTPNELARQADGSVWQIEQPIGDPAPEDMQVVGMSHTETGIIYRVVGQFNGHHDVQSTHPTLEDGYVWLMQQHRTPQAV